MKSGFILLEITISIAMLTLILGASALTFKTAAKKYAKISTETATMHVGQNIFNQLLSGQPITHPNLTSVPYQSSYTKYIFAITPTQYYELIIKN